MTPASGNSSDTQAAAVSVVRVLQRNALWSFVAAFARLAANAVLFIMVARFYGPEVFGQFSTAHTFATIIGMLADFGFDMLLTTRIATDRNEVPHLLPRMMMVKVVLSLLALGIMVGWAQLPTFSAGTRDLMYIFSFYLFFSAMLSFFFALFKGHEELQHEMIITVVLNTALIAALFLLGLWGVSVMVVALAFVGARVLGLGLAMQRGKRFITALRPRWDRAWFASAWRQVSVFGTFFVFGNLFFTLDTILLSQWKGDLEVGIYQSVFRIAVLILVGSDIAIGALLPTLSRFFVADRDLWNRLGSIADRTLFYGGLLLGFVMVVGAVPIIGLVYGLDTFGRSVGILQIFGLIIAVRYAVEIPALLLTTSQRQHVRMVLVIGATVLNFALNAYAIPRYGATGAAYASLLTNIAVGAGYILSVRDLFAQQWLTWERVLPLGVVLAGGAFLYAGSTASLLAGIPVVAVVYLVTVLVVGYTKAERELLRKAALGRFAR